MEEVILKSRTSGLGEAGNDEERNKLDFKEMVVEALEPQTLEKLAPTMSSRTLTILALPQPSGLGW